MLECKFMSRSIPYGTLSISRRDKMSALKEPRKLLLICLYVIFISVIIYMGFKIYEEHYILEPEKCTITLEVLKVNQEQQGLIIEDNIYYVDKNLIEDNLDIKYT